MLRKVVARKFSEDTLIHLYSNNIRASLTQARNITQEVKNRCEIQDFSLIKEVHTAFTASLLMSSFLKGQERVKICSEHNKLSFGLPYSCAIYAEKWDEFNIRGFGKKNELENYSNSGNFLVGKTLAGATSEYQSIFGFEDSQLGLTDSDLDNYFQKSEQIPTKVYISGEYSQEFPALGLIIQALPGTENDYILETFEKILQKQAFKDLHHSELDETNFQALFEDLKEEFGYRKLNYTYKCNCTKQLVSKFLEKLPTETLVSMKSEPIQLIACNHCNYHYEFTPDEIDKMITNEFIKYPF